ncbi:3-keto-5-aminohexanoate cleavage protein [Paraburkholderia dipogonis]|uniref:3-keto-5-aminohexanoate cleavage protein n=1 Tax=Paraburkholderia dipogonis TaxID=1211383 RepID=A0A4Y8MX67_9BURK|nr:3-keto-5-aminohexanoate cleavage protein [Paraburkholderia dipogonis]TFE41913.1 3-keto-5-aminohexanoate cleavage protein [Paraburkholderia dipogonis]
MSKERKVIITCAVTGSIHTPTMSPYLPITAEQIATNAIDAANAGAAIVHLHARNPRNGHPDQSPELFEPFLKEIRSSSNVVMNLTTGGSPAMSIEDRAAPAFRFKPEVASLNMGTMNFGLYPMLGRYKEFKYDWEYEYLVGSRHRIFRNTFQDIEYILRGCAEHGTRFEIECYDIGHLYTLSHFAERGVIKPPFFIQSVFGILGGIGGDPEDVLHMRRTADRLFGRDTYIWSVLGVGRNQIPVATQSVTLGGNVRVGLEDSLWLKKGQLARSCAEQVTLVRSLIETMGLEIATPDDARSILGLKGASNVNF